MSRLRPIPARKVERVLRRLGFVLARTVGSHRIYLHPATGRRTTVAFHGGGEEIPAGTMKSILADIALEWAQFEKLL
ncbi:MAG: type II toxin-antitoxin system HicA family toxin [bacterium]